MGIQFVQIACGQTVDGGHYLYALDDSGAVWCYHDDDKCWSLLSGQMR